MVGIRILFSSNDHNEYDGLLNEAFSASANFYVSGTGFYSGVLDQRICSINWNAADWMHDQCICNGDCNAADVSNCFPFDSARSVW